ncbi:MAG: ATP-binding cassette domain-containing protein [Thiobacillus sp.]|nr:ATP-binding cassette domain-containing protein [Thiobacillus sp.]
MTSVIVAENLSKKYIIDHQRKERYTALRDVLADGAKRAVSKWFRPRTERDDPEHEEFWALRDVGFEIHQGDRVGIIGRNGAGKSTLLKILSRITEPTSGKVSIKGHVASLLEVGTGFHPELTGRENIYLNGAILGMSKADIAAKFDEIVTFAEVEKFLDTPVKRYSSGMYVRLAFAVAAHLDPEIFIVDEVLAVGDAQFQKKCMGKMRERHEERTILFVSHNLNAVRALCNKALLMENGKVAAFGDTVEIIEKYMEGLDEQGEMSREWPDASYAPQNSISALSKVSLCDASGGPLQETFTNTQLNIQIRFVVKVPGSTVGITLILYDSQGNCVFSSINNNDSEWYGKPMPIGTYVTTCQIPKNYFNDGWFSISINMFGKNYSEPKIENDILRFHIQDSSEIRGDYHGEYCGCVRPCLGWDTQALNNKGLRGL